MWHAAIAAALLASSAPAAAGWNVVRTPHFEVYGASGPSAAETAVALESFHAALVAVYPVAPAGNAPARRVPVIAFRDLAAFAPYRPLGPDGKPIRNAAGYLLRESGVSLIALTLGDLAEGNIQHEYVHLAMEKRALPPWFSEGLASYYATAARFADHVTLGAPPAGYLSLLRSRVWIPVERLLAVRRDDDEYTDPNANVLFYAEAWLLVHWCLDDPSGARRTRLADLATALDAGKTPEAAIRAAFGTDPAGLTAALREYCRGSSLPTVKIPFAAPFAPPETEPLPVADAEMEARIGQLLVMIDRGEEALPHLRAAVAADPESPLGWEGLGLAAVARSDRAAAHEAFGNALLYGSKLAAAQYGFGVSFPPDATSDELRIAEHALVAATRIEPTLLVAYRALGTLELALDQPAVADDWIHRGLAVDPYDTGLQLQLARSELRAGRTDAARALAERLATMRDANIAKEARALLAELPAVP
jgi:tetratricopeptide (TPR) repeat protein